MTHPEPAVEADWQDALTFLSPPTPPGDAPMLEVHQIWGNLIVDSRHYSPTGPPVQIGDGLSTRWRFLGVDMGRVPKALRPLLATFAPLWSDFETTQTFDFRLPDGVDDGWTLFGPDGDGGFLARIPPGWDAVVEVDGQVAPCGASEVRMSDVSRLVVERGAFRFVARRVPRAARVESRSPGPDPWFLGLTASAGVLFAAAVLVTNITVPTREVHEVEIDEPLAAMIMKVPEPPKVVVGTSGPEGASEAAPNRKPTKSPGPKSDRQRAEDAGIAGTLESLLGSATLSPDLVASAGKLIGGRGTTIGGDGLAGRAGGCDEGSLACGSGSAEGHDGTGLRGDGPRGGGPPGWGKTDGRIAVVAADSIVCGALDKAVIDEVVKNHTAAIRYCYQRELQRSPGLGGKIAVKFTIARDGSVSAASVKTSTMGSPAVESCVVSRFMRMTFPEPRGGGIVVVSYPFLFAPN